MLSSNIDVDLPWASNFIKHTIILANWYSFDMDLLWSECSRDLLSLNDFFFFRFFRVLLDVKRELKLRNGCQNVQRFWANLEKEVPSNNCTDLERLHNNYAYV